MTEHAHKMGLNDPDELDACEEGGMEEGFEEDEQGVARVTQLERCRRMKYLRRCFLRQNSRTRGSTCSMRLKETIFSGSR